MGALEEVTKLKNDLVAAHEAAELERVMDVLKALAAFEKIDESLVKKSKAGKTLKDLKSAYDKRGNKEVADVIFDILKKWTKMAKQKGTAAKSGMKAAAEESSAPAPAPAKAKAKANAPAPAPPSAMLQVEKGPHREKIIKVLSEALKGSAEGTVDVAVEVSNAIEDVINKKNPYDEDNFKNNVEYNSKVRSLVFNIKRNKDLATAVLEGTISPSELTTMTPNELADKELAMKRQAMVAIDADARRTDWLDVHKADVLANCGVKEDENIQKLEDEVQEVSDDD